MSDSRGALVRRVLHEHRRWIWPLGVLLGVNVLAVVLGVLPMSRAVASAEQRAVEATADARVAASELADATAARDGRDTATRELASFRTEVAAAGTSTESPMEAGRRCFCLGSAAWPASSPSSSLPPMSLPAAWSSSAVGSSSCWRASLGARKPVR